MTKREAIIEFAQRRFDPIPTEWVRIIADRVGEYPRLPMWGTMWQIENYWGEKLIAKAHIMDAYTNEDDDEEMTGEHNVRDIHDQATAVYVYEIDGRHLIGVHGAGWDFYDGVWDMLYDLYGMNWHEEETAYAEDMYTAQV